MGEYVCCVPPRPQKYHPHALARTNAIKVGLRRMRKTRRQSPTHGCQDVHVEELVDVVVAVVAVILVVVLLLVLVVGGVGRTGHRGDTGPRPCPRRREGQG